MKFAHISDIHLGYTSGNKIDPTTKINVREQDGYNALEEALQDIVNHKDEVDFVLCTGDFFHSPKPSMRTITKGIDLLRTRLTKNNIPFYCLTGNHDATDNVKDVPSSKILDIPEAGLYSYTEPYHVITLDENVCLHFVSHHGYIAQKETMERVKPIEGKFNILCSHGSVYDENMGMILHAEAEPREVVIPESVLRMNWDYILLGHIHERGWVHSTDRRTDTAGQRIFYGGSLLRRGFSDKPCPLGRGWTLWNIENEQMTPTFYQVTQRIQEDIYIDCGKKTPLAIEDEIVEHLQRIGVEQQPIVRFTLTNINRDTKSQIRLQRFSELGNQCLTFTIKYLTKEETQAQVNGDVFSFDLIQSYQAFWEEKKVQFEVDQQEIIGSVSLQLLKDGQDKTLEE